MMMARTWASGTTMSEAGAIAETLRECSRALEIVVAALERVADGQGVPRHVVGLSMVVASDTLGMLDEAAANVAVLAETFAALERDSQPTVGNVHRLYPKGAL